jgi:hypothetical protein
MSREDIILMAMEAGILLKRFDVFSAEFPDLERFFQAAYAAGAEAEREACAKVCETLPPLGPYKEVQIATLEDAATAIRARGQA